MMNEIKTVDFGREKLAIFTFYDPRNRNAEVTKSHQVYHAKMGIPINYIEIDYRRINHGGVMEQIINGLSSNVEYFVFLDNDALILRRDGISIIYDKLKDGMTVFGGAQNSNHINVNPTHPFVQPSTFCISATLYKRLGSPRLADGVNKRSDTCEEVTWLCQEKGYNVCMIWPRNYHWLTSEESRESGNPMSWKLTDTINYGLGTTYGDLFFHAGMQSLPRSAEVFFEKVNEVLDQKRIEAVTVCVGYSEFLDESLKYNKKQFNHYIVVTTEQDVKTREVCKKHDVTCILTNSFYDNGATFDKGRGISVGLQHLKHNQWVCHLDCDVVLPFNFHQIVPLDTLSKDSLWGTRRFIVETKEDWEAFLKEEKKEEDFIGPEWGGWGCGYCQIWHMDAKALVGVSRDFLYPSYPTAGESDILMLKRFHPDVNSVGKLDLSVAHLGNVGVNHDTKDQKTFFNDNS